MENKINEESFKMNQIPAKLFNSQYLSDVTFSIEGKEIYAHSLLLMVRSDVFQQQLEPTLGVKKLIPITGYRYEVFYQLIRFIYTDQIDISDADWFHLMKLAKEYKVLKLVTDLMNYKCSDMKMFYVCVFENHKIDLKTLKQNAQLGPARMFDKILHSNEFLSIHPDVLEEILKVNQMKEGITESYIIETLVRWMKHHCKQNEIQFSECREKFKHLIRLIRFPAMSSEELRNIQIKYPDLLAKKDFKDVAIQKIYGAEYDEGTWNSVPRMNFVGPYEIKSYPDAANGRIRFSVTSDVVLGGFVFGEKEVYSDQPKNITFYHNKDDRSATLCSSFEFGSGASIRILPKYIYTIYWKCETIKWWSRKPETDLIVNAPPNTVKIIEAHPTIFEILFLKPDGSTFD